MSPTNHPDNVSERLLELPVRIDDAASAARAVVDLCRFRAGALTAALYLDEGHRLTGHVIVSGDDTARPISRSVLLGAAACRSRHCVAAAYGTNAGAGAPSTADRRRAAALALVCRAGALVVVECLAVSADGSFQSLFRLAP